MKLVPIDLQNVKSKESFMGFKNASQIAVNIKHREDLKHTSKTQMVRKCKLTEGLFFF